MLAKYRAKKAKYCELVKEAKYWRVCAKYCASVSVYKVLTCCVSEGNWRPRDNAGGWPPSLAPTWKLGTRNGVKYWAQGGVFKITGVILWWNSSSWGSPEAEKIARQTQSRHTLVDCVTQACDI